MHYIDLIILGLYLLTCLSIGFLKKKNENTLEGFTFYKEITLSALVCTIFGSVIGAGSSLGTAEKVYIFGFIYLIRYCLQPLFWLFSAYIIAPGIERFKGCLTISDIMKDLYGKPAEIITSFMSIVMSVGILSIQAIALGQTFNYFFGISNIYGVFISYGIIVAYSVFGGIRAIILNDIFKTVILFLVLPTICIIGFLNSSGMDNIIAKLPEQHLHLEFDQNNILLLISLLFVSLMPSFHPELVQRYLMATNSEQLKKSFIWIFTCSIAFSAAIIGIAYIVKAEATAINPILVLPYFINNFLPIGIKGLMIAGVIAVIMSKAEAQLNSGGLILYKNYIAYFFPQCSDKTELNIFRAMICVLALISIIFVSFVSTDILSLIYLLMNFWSPIILIPALVGFIGFESNTRTFIASVITALSAVAIGRLYAGEFATISYMFGVIGSAVGFFVMHYLQVIYGKLPKQVISIINFSAIKESFQDWKANLYEDYKRYADVEPKYNTFLYFAYALLVFSLGHLVWYGSKHPTFAAIWIVAQATCLLLILRECLFAPRLMQKILPIYFKVALITALPTLSSYILFINKGNDFLLLTGAFGALSIIHIIDALRAIVYYTIGLIIAFILLAIGGEISSSVDALKYIPYIYLYFFLVSYAVVRKREYEQEERVQNMQVVGGAMAHEVRSPLASVNMCAQTIVMLMDETRANLKDGQMFLDAEQTEMLKSMSESILKVSKKGISVIDSLLLSMKKEIIADEKSLHSMGNLILRSIEEYKNLSDKTDQVTINIKEDFQLACSPKYVKQMIFNLLNNAFKYGGSNAEVEITIERNQITFKDNGKGIPKEKLPNVFQRFYTSSDTGTGLGLAFCKMVVEDMGGKINCQSEVGSFTRFVMSFS